MLKTLSAFSAAALALSLTGCVGTGPNTEQGAVTGGALGAIAGAVIGHNSRGGDAVGGAILGAAAGAVAGGTIGNSVDHQQGTIYQGTQPEPVYRGRRVSRVESYGPPAPPPPQTENVPPSPAPNAVWIPGYWNYDGRGYAWAGGHWEIPPPMARAYMAAHWENRGNQYVYVPGYWQ